MLITDRDKYLMSITEIVSVSVGLTAVKLLKPDGARTCLTFFPLVAEDYTLFLNAGGTLGAGPTIHGATNPWTVKLDEHAKFVVGEIWAIASLADQTVNVLATRMIH